MNNDDKELKKILKELQKGQKELFKAQATTNKRIDDMEVKFEAQFAELKEQLAEQDIKFNELATATNDRFEIQESITNKLVIAVDRLNDKVDRLIEEMPSRQDYHRILEALDVEAERSQTRELETAAQNAQLDRHENRLDDHESRIGGLEGARA